MDPVLSALSAYAGKYEKALMGKMYRDLQLAADGIQVIPGLKNTMKLSRLSIGKGLKPYSGNFVAMDQLKYSERSISVEKAQRDIEIEPEKYRTSWMGELRPGTETNSNKAIPFAQFTWEQIMKETAEEVVELLYYGKGKAAFAAYNAGTAYSEGAFIAFTNTAAKNEVQYYKAIAATTAGQSPLTNPEKWLWAGNLAITKGYDAIFTDAINNEGFDNIISTGAITSADAYGQFTSVWRGLPEKVRQNGATILCSMDSQDALTDDYENKIKKNFDESPDGVVYLAKTNRKCKIKPVNWLSGSNRLIGTPVNNLLLGTDSLNDMNTIKNIETHYTMQSSLTFVLGTQVRDLDVLVLNDQH